MKIFLSSRCRAVTAATGLVSLLVGASLVVAAPGGGTTAGGTAAGGAAGAGGHGGGGTSGVGHGGGGVSAGQHVGSGSNGNAGPGRSFSPGFSGGAGVNVARSGGPAGGGRLVTPNFSGLSHSAFGNGQVGNTGFAPNRGIFPLPSRSFNDNSSVPRVNTPTYANPLSARRSTLPTRSNAWTDARTPRSAPAARAGRIGANGAYDAGQSYLQGRLNPGQHLYPGASGYSAADGVGNRPWQDSRGGRGSYRHNHNYNPYYYNNLYYPLFLGGFFPAYYGGFDGGIGYGSGFGSSYSTSLANEDLSNGLVTTNNLATYNNQDRNAPADPSLNDPRPPADQPTQVGPPSPTDTNIRPSNEAGPDSLVEAVQSELATRGYFPGKVDAMYGESTREAIRRFQADQKLSVTGRINEATLHALQLD